MSVEDRYARFVAERAQPPPLTSGDTFHWDGRGAASRSVGRMHVSEPTGCAAWLGLPPEAGHRASPSASTRPMCLLPSPPAPAIDWAKEAARLTLYLDPELLLAPLHQAPRNDRCPDVAPRAWGVSHPLCASRPARADCPHIAPGRVRRASAPLAHPRPAPRPHRAGAAGSRRRRGRGGAAVR